MANTASNVTTGKPKVGGAIYKAPKGTTLPTNATTALSSDFICLGYISEDGLTETISRESQEVKAWGGDTVLSAQTGMSKSWKTKFIEGLNADVLKTIFGAANVTVAAQTGAITIKENSAELEEFVWVVELVFRGGKLYRIVIPQGKITEVSDIVYKDNEPVGYKATISATPDTSGNFNYKYIAAPST